MPMKRVEKAVTTEFEDKVVKMKLKVKKNKEVKKKRKTNPNGFSSEINKKDGRVQVVSISGQSEVVLGKVTLIIHCQEK